MTKASIRQTGDRTVTLTHDCPYTGERVRREFWVPRNDGRKYVREGDRQVCDELSSRGNTLSITDPADLLPLIRNEWKKFQARHRREFNR